MTSSTSHLNTSGLSFLTSLSISLSISRLCLYLSIPLSKSLQNSSAIYSSHLRSIFTSSVNRFPSLSLISFNRLSLLARVILFTVANIALLRCLLSIASISAHCSFHHFSFSSLHLFLTSLLRSLYSLYIFPFRFPIFCFLRTSCNVPFDTRGFKVLGRSFTAISIAIVGREAMRS